MDSSTDTESLSDDPATDWDWMGARDRASVPTANPDGTSPDGDVSPVVAYLSMEVGLDPNLPTYSGGLGVLAGDTLRAAADRGVPMVAVTLVHRKGYFRQALEPDGRQVEHPVEWSPEERLEAATPRVVVDVEGREVHLRAWRRAVRGHEGFRVPLYFLDADLPENAPEDRRLTDDLYGDGRRYRLAQELLLGVGGLRMLRALGYDRIRTFHMNEGHSALVTLGLLEDELPGTESTEAAVEAVRRQCVFTTHTPVPAGHDQFPLSLAREVVGERRVELLDEAGGFLDGSLNMTHLALHFSRYLNGVAMRHRQVSVGLFPGYPVDSITNGVHVRTWVAPPFRALFDRHIPEWRLESFNLRYAVGIPRAEIREAHEQAKRELLDEVEQNTGRRLDPGVLTLGFARRATAYKRADLLLADPDRLRRMAAEGRRLQILYAGKAHPADESGQEMIRRVHEVARELGADVPVLYLEDYDMVMAAKLVAGVDVWVNTPRKPQEASGTSGMKAALNGVPSLSVLDGWWIEGHVEGVTGWAVGEGWDTASDREREAASLYDKLENAVAPMYYDRPDDFASIMRSAVSLNGSFFNAERMMLQYVTNAYGLPLHAAHREVVPAERAAD